jgi:tRNA pseudouridine55 synthase
VARVKRLLPKKTKIGHTGTLDPLASGLLVLLIGRSTRLSRYVMGLKKAYSATARLGAVSDTLDAEGEITHLDAPFPSENTLRDSLPALTGDILQTPPMVSALKREGQRLYDLHRQGITVEREPRPVTVHRFALTAFDPVLGVSDALPPENLTPDSLHNHIILPTEVVGHLSGVAVSGAVRDLVCHGGRMRACGVEGSYRVICGEELLAVYRDDGEEGRAEVVLCAG